MAKVEVDTTYLLALQEILRAAAHVSDAFELSAGGDAYQFNGSMNLIENLKDAVAALDPKVYTLGDNGWEHDEDNHGAVVYEPRRNGVG